jgi:hypothetical protein
MGGEEVKEEAEVAETEVSASVFKLCWLWLSCQLKGAFDE